MALFASHSGALAQTYRSPVSALDCPEALLESAHREMHSIPVADEKNDRISYSKAAAELIDFYQNVSLKQKSPLNSSPLVLAIETHPIGDDPVADAIRTAQKKGVCQENPDLVREIDGELGESPSAFLKDLLLRQPSGSGNLDSSDCSGKRYSNPLEADSLGLIFKTIADLSRQENGDAKLKKIARLCAGSNRAVLKKLPAPTSKALQYTAELYSLIQDRYGSNSGVLKQPIALDICKSVLEKGRTFSGKVWPSDGKNTGNCNAESENYAVTVLGSRRNRSGLCELRIKNPSGHCKGYSQDWECDPAALWVDVETLGRNTHRAVYLE